MFNRIQNEKGQTALETAIILIAFVVVASVFAFTILSAGSASTEKGQEAIYSGLEGVQSSMSVKGTVVAQGASGAVTDIIFNLSLVSGGDPVDLTDSSGTNVVVISYRDAAQLVNEVTWATDWVGNNDGDVMLEDGETAEITVDASALGTALGPNTEFTLEIKPLTGAVIQINRTTPASIEAVMELR